MRTAHTQSCDEDQNYFHLLKPTFDQSVRKTGVKGSGISLKSLIMGIFNFVTLALLGVSLNPEGVKGFAFSRRQAFEGIATAVITPNLVSILPANAAVDEETPRVVSRMGGLLVCLFLLWPQDVPILLDTVSRPILFYQSLLSN